MGREGKGKGAWTTAVGSSFLRGTEQHCWTRQRAKGVGDSSASRCLELGCGT